jgi:hypothetical protein
MEGAMEGGVTAQAPTVIRVVTPATCQQHVFEAWHTPPDHEPAWRICVVCRLREERAG